jgi:hypothetical protein
LLDPSFTTRNAASEAADVFIAITPSEARLVIPVLGALFLGNVRDADGAEGSRLVEVDHGRVKVGIEGLFAAQIAEGSEVPVRTGSDDR